MEGVPGKEAFISYDDTTQEGVTHHCTSYVGRVEVLPSSLEEADKCVGHCRSQCERRPDFKVAVRCLGLSRCVAARDCYISAVSCGLAFDW